MRSSSGELVGLGVAIGMYPGSAVPVEARVRVKGDASVEVSVGAHEMGQGVRTAIALVVANELNVDPASVAILIGDTIAPPQHVTAGAWGTATACPAVHAACLDLKTAASALAQKENTGLAGKGKNATAIAAILRSTRRTFVEGTSKRVPAGLPPQAFTTALQGLVTPEGPDFPDFLCFQSIAHFVEVALDPYTYQIRVQRVVSVVDCGKVVSRRTAHSQVLGGFIWGLGACLREASAVDPRFGGFMNSNIAEYLVPVNADIMGEHIVDFIDEPDLTFNPLGVKGLGEVVMTGVAPAIANAVYHATGCRIRSLPITLDDFHSPTG